MQTAPPAPQSFVDDVIAIAKGGGDLTLEWFRSARLQVETKSDGTPVTEADRAAERYIRERIEELTPGSRLVGEEEGTSEGTSGYTWYIDPIDGTKGFARGVPLYSTLVAVEDEHGYVAGVIHIPATGETVWAGRGLGAHTNDGPAHVSAAEGLEGSYVTTSSVSRWGSDVFTRVLHAGMDIRGWGDGYGFLMAATGRVDAMVDLGVGKPWDFGPMPIIMSEAGGRFSDLDGEPTITSPSAVATNGTIHDALLRSINGQG
jgi:histidinol-phosphatase